MTLGQQPPEPRAALAGRHTERLLLERVVRGAAQGRPGAVLLHGEAGVGKTRLVADVVQGAQADGFHLLWGQCLHFGASSSPYLPIASAFDSWLTAAEPDDRDALLADVPTITDLLPRTPGGTTDADSARLLATVDAAVTALTDQRPTVLIIDDLQWADVTSLDVLAYLIAGPRHRPLSLVLSYRDEELPEGHPLHGWLADMLRMPTVTDVPLERFTVEETTDQLALLLGGRPTEALVAAVQRRSAGNAYFNELLVRGIDRHAEELPADLPHMLRVAVLAKWHALDEATREVVRIVSAAGRPLSATYLASLTGRLGVPDAQVRHA
ncbi:MAG: ATP-binding protein, partial [Nocardioidaceae bacterium]